jgi:hypothetical protein
LAIIRDWIENGTRVISDCWGAYNNLGSLGYEHRTFNHIIHLRHPVTGAHTNKIENIWSRVNVFLGRHNQGEDYHYQLAHYLFAARCKAEGISAVIQFLHHVNNKDCSLCHLTASSQRAT